MGAKHTLEDDLITFRLTSKQMARSAKKCESNAAAQKEKVKKAIKDGNMEGARIYGQNAIREKNQALNFLRLGSRIDAVASRLETAIRMQQINKAMTQTVKGMSNAMKSMKVEQIASTMEEFEKSFEDMDVRSGNNRCILSSLLRIMFLMVVTSAKNIVIDAYRLYGKHDGIFHQHDHPSRGGRQSAADGGG